MTGLIIPLFAATDDILLTALGSIRAHMHGLPAWAKLIIVLNGGNIYAEDLPGDIYSSSTIVDLPHNIGFTGAVNVGIRTAVAMGCDYYIVSSADVFPPAGGEWVQAMMSDGLISAREADSDAHCDHAGACPFWGGMFAFPEALLEDVGYIPTEYMRIGDAAFAARAATRGWAVTRSDLEVEHRHPHAANRASDPESRIVNAEKARLRHAYSFNVCDLLLDLNSLSPFERWERTRAYRSQP